LERDPSDWWTRGVAPLAALHGSLFLTLQARPGKIAPLLWTWGPPILVLMTALLLMAAFISAMRGRGWSRRRTAAFAGLCLLVATLPAYQTFPSAHDDHPSEIDIRLPLEGPITVAWGGPEVSTNYHVSAPAERWAYDLLMTIDGRSHAGDGRSVSDYYVYAQPVIAPADGRIVSVHDGDPDAMPHAPESRRAGGNRIVLEIAPGQFLFLVHLKAGSIAVTAGKFVRQGDVIARVGNSGNSSEPHLHVHVQDTAVPGRGQGIPFYFSRYVKLPDNVPVSRAMPAGGIRRGRFLGEVIAAAE
jgi:murein DD-endopeptidase MepM/ murein hydrolase activator NlpD